MVVGMTVLAGRRAAGAAGAAEVVIAPANSDGPPLGALLWPHESEYVIASQSPHHLGNVASPPDAVTVS
jgi:hypothetical protein